MDKERLEEIEAKYSIISITSKQGGIEYTEVEVEDLVFLIQNGFEQAERVQELEELIEDYKTVNKELHDRRKKLRKQNKRYREHFNWIIQNSTDKYAVQASYEALEGEE